MDERINEFIEELRSRLAGLPQHEIDNAVLYYEEYLNDAMDAGKNIEDIIANFGQPGQIAAGIRAELSINQAQQSPNIKSYSKALSSIMKTVTTPFAIFILSICLLPSVILVGVFFIISVCLFIAGIVAGLGMIYQAVSATFSIFTVLGSLGLGLFTAGLLFILAHLFYWFARLMIRLSALMIRHITKKPGQYRPEPGNTTVSLKPWKKRAVTLAYLCVIVIGLILFSASGLPLKYFTIFNSMEQPDMKTYSYEYNPADASKIIVDTTHTNIRVTRSGTEKISITYEKVDWLDFEIGLDNNTLIFTEKSNNTLPLFQLVRLHENSAELVIALPAGFDPLTVNLESFGGYIYVDNISADMEIRTRTGNIFINPDPASPANIEAVTRSGRIETDPLQETPIGFKTGNGKEYMENNGSKNTIKASTSTGGIFISPVSK